MDKRQINQLNMYDTVEQVLDVPAYNAIWTANPPLNTAITTFISHVDAINASDTAQKTSSVGTTETKDTAKLTMAKAAIKVANAGKAYSTATGNETLFAAMNHTQTEITHAADTDADDICQNLHDDVQAYIALMAGYGADANSLTALQNLINTYSAMIGAPGLQQSVVAHATITLEQHFTAANALLKNSLDTLMEQYETSNANFYNQYHSARVIHDLGHRKSVILEGFIYNAAGHAIAGALVSLTPIPNPSQGEGNLHHKTTDATGHYKFTRLHIGSFSIKVSAAGFVTQTKTIDVTENGTFDTDFTLVAAAGGGTVSPAPTPNTSSQ